MAHRFTSTAVCENLAQAGLDLLATRVRENLDCPVPDWNRPLWQGGLKEFLLLPVEELVQRGGQLDEAGFDELAARFFGEQWRHTLDMLEADYPGSTISLSMSFEASPLYNQELGLEDPVEKLVRMTLRSKAEFAEASVVLSAVQEIKVINPLAPLTCKFTLFVDQAADGDSYNIYVNNENGLPAPGAPQAPVACFNTPADAVDDTQLTLDNVDMVRNGKAFDSSDRVRGLLKQRGWIYLGTTGGDIRLNLTNGASLDDNTRPTLDFEAGEFFHIYNPLTRNSEAGYFIVGLPPEWFRHSYPSLAGGEEQPYINFLFWGFHHPSPGGTDLRGDGALGASLRTLNSSILHLYGTDNEPSRTLVFGPVYQSLVRLSYLAIDRDASSADEELQLANFRAAGGPDGFFISIRDTYDPMFRYVDSEQTFSRELSREAAGQPLQILAPVFGRLTNQNSWADLNGNNFYDPATEPVIDPAFREIRIDTSRYTYRNMFDGRYEGSAGEADVGYRNFMSEVENIPYIEMIDYMFYCRKIPPKSHESYQGLVAGGEISDYLHADDVTIEFSDPLHDSLQNKVYYSGCLKDLFHSGSNPSPAEQILRARVCRTFSTSEEFLASYPLTSTGENTPKLLSFNGSILIEQGDLDLPSCVYNGSGLIVLADPDGATIHCHGLQPVGSSVLTLATLTGDIEITGGVPHRALFIAPRGSLVHNDQFPLDLGWGLAVRKLPPETLSAGGSFRHESLVDPATDDRIRGGYIDFYSLHSSDVFLEWSRGASS